MNSTIINCIFFVLITYLLILTLTLSWRLPLQYVFILRWLTIYIPASVAIVLKVYNKQKLRDIFKLSSRKNCAMGFLICVALYVLS